MAKSRSNFNNGGIMGTGVFGHFGTVISCKDSDTSLYCKFMKIVNLFIAIIIICVIIYFIYHFFFSKKR